ncbi:MAG: hypothetical protein R3C05_09000 [Pirellulaceae bacterium]
MTQRGSSLPEVDTSVQRRQQLEHCIRDAPADVQPYLELASIHRALDNPFEAQKVLEKATRIASDNLDVLWNWKKRSWLAVCSDYSTRSNCTTGTHSRGNRRLGTRTERLGDAPRGRLSQPPATRSESTKFACCLGRGTLRIGNFDEAASILQPRRRPANRLQGQFGAACVCRQPDIPEALAAFRAASLRRAFTAPAEIRLTALRHAADLSLRFGLTATCRRYLRGIISLNPTDEIVSKR